MSVNAAAGGFSVLPVAQLLGQVDVQDVRQDGDELRGVAERRADGVSRVDVVQLCRGQEVKGHTHTRIFSFVKL